MALYILTPGIQPLGDFDVLDTDQDSIVGGEIMTLDEASGTTSTTEKAAYDVFDGYIADEPTAAATRSIVRIADETTEAYKVFYLADEGKAKYGVLFGEVIGSPVGQSVTGTNLGPSTMSGSGKCTCWDKAGLYAVSTNALNADVVPSVTGTYAVLYDTPLPGTTLYRDTAGKLARAAGTADKVAVFVELTNNGSLVTTSAKLIGAVQTYDRIKISYLGATHNV